MLRWKTMPPRTLGIPAFRFIRQDLNNVEALGQKFDAISLLRSPASSALTRRLVGRR